MQNSLSAMLGTLTIERLAIHEVPRHVGGGQTPEPTFSEIESPLDDELRTFFRGRVIDAAGSTSAYGVVFDSGSTSPIPALVHDYLHNTDCDFLAISKTMAQHLHNVQDQRNPGGLVTVIGCTVNHSQRALSILKLEKEEGVRLSEITEAGKRTFSVQHLKDLILTEHTRLFKIGFFTPDDEGEPYGALCDEQRGRRPRVGVASFFLRTFLGCTYMDDPRLATQTFFHAAQDFINSNVTDPEERTAAINHLASELTSNRTTVHFRRFARDYLPADKADLFEEFIGESGIEGRTIRKDLGLIESQLRKIAIEFKDGIQIVGEKEVIEKNVTVKKAARGMTRAEIVGLLSRVRNR